MNKAEPIYFVSNSDEENMQELSEVQSAVITRIAKGCGMEEFQISAQSGSEKGDNYMGIITTVTVKSGTVELHLVLKTSHSNEQFRNTMRISIIFSREIYVYETVFPIYRKIQEECRVKNPFYANAKLCGSYVGPNVECLVMEDLRTKHFKLWNRKVPMNPDHISAVLREYAKLHSLGFVANKKYPEIFNKFLTNMRDIFMEKDSTFAKLNDFTSLMSAKILRIVEGNKSATEAMNRYASKLDDYYTNELTRSEHKLVVIHGDGWCNNIMFKYEVNKYSYNTLINRYRFPLKSKS